MTPEEQPPSKCELRPGIGLCDCCGLALWPQQYMGNGHMICLDCLGLAQKEMDDFDRICNWMEGEE